MVTSAHENNGGIDLQFIFVYLCRALVQKNTTFQMANSSMDAAFVHYMKFCMHKMGINLIGNNKCIKYSNN